MIWRWVVGYKGYYKVSDTGKVKSVPRTLNTLKGVRWYPGKNIKTSYRQGWLSIGNFV